MLESGHFKRRGRLPAPGGSTVENLTSGNRRMAGPLDEELKRREGEARLKKRAKKKREKKRSCRKKEFNTDTATAYTTV